MENNTQVQSQGERSGLAVTSLVLSLLLIIPLTGLVGLILGIIALVKISNSNGKLTGKKMALAGVIIGGIRTILMPFVIIGIVAGLLGPGVFTAHEEASQLRTASNMRQIGIALHTHAKNNGGDLPANLDELVTEDYLDDAEVLDNAFGGAMEMDSAAAGGYLYGMNATDVLVTDNESTTGKSTGYKLRADGSVEGYGILNNGINIGKVKNEAAFDLNQTGIAIYAYAKDNEGTLPNELYELIEEDYIGEISEEFVYNMREGYIYYVPGENLYDMNTDDILVEDPKYELMLYADGSVKTLKDE